MSFVFSSNAGATKVMTLTGAEPEGAFVMQQTKSLGMTSRRFASAHAML